MLAQPPALARPASPSCACSAARLLPRVWPLSRRALVQGAGRGFLDRLRPRDLRLDRPPGTRWKFGWLPLGGYVKFIGDMGPRVSAAETSAVHPRGLPARPVWQRFLIVLAGPGRQFPARHPNLRSLLHLRRHAADQCRRHSEAEFCGTGGGDPSGRSHFVGRRHRHADVSRYRQRGCSAPNQTVAVELERAGQVRRQRHAAIRRHR